MKTRHLILTAILVTTGLVACQNNRRCFEQAETLFQKGVEQRTDKQSEAAAESFSQALLAVKRCDMDKPEVQRLKGQIEDNLGFCYWKHELFEEALPLYKDAVELFRELNADTLLMTVLRNCGRTAASLGDTDNSYARRKSRIKQEKMNGLQDKQSFEEIINEI